MQIQKILSKSLLLAALLWSSSESITFEEYKRSQQIEFSKQKKAFQNYKKEQQEAFKNYKKELEKYWKDPLTNTKKRIVNYSKDQKSRTIIDFEKNDLTLQTIAKNQKEAREKLALALAKAATFTNRDFYTHDKLQQQLSRIEKKHHIPQTKIDTKPVLAPIFFKKKATKESLSKLIHKEIKPKNIKEKNAPKQKDEKIYTIQIKLPKNSTIKRSAIYYNDVHNAAKKEQLPIPLIFAIMHTESSFNPMARSYVPAYGLMQIVPKTAGVDAYYYLYREKRLVGSSFLYNTHNNIRMGSAYLHLLYYRYLKHIKNPTSRLYCTIAAYNTGAGNVARAFGNTTNTYQAAKVINRLSPQEVYERLLKDLRYEEPKKYLKNVTKRVEIYKKIYES